MGPKRKKPMETNETTSNNDEANQILYYHDLNDLDNLNLAEYSSILTQCATSLLSNKNDPKQLSNTIFRIAANLLSHNNTQNILKDINNKLDLNFKQPSKPSYASILQNPSQTTPTNKKNQEDTIIINSSNNTSTTIIESQIKSLIKSSPNKYKINHIKSTNKTVIIKTPKNTINTNKLIKEINNNPKTNHLFNAYTPKAKDPTIVIKNVSTDTEIDSIINQICDHNEELTGLQNEIKFIFKINQDKPKTMNLAFRVSPKIFHIISNQLSNRIFLPTQCCIVQHKIFIRQCQKCFLFNHKTSECINNHLCKNCGKEKTDNHICSHINHCPNCSKSIKHKDNTNHLPNTKQCPIYSTQIQYIHEQTQYTPLPPQ